VWLAVSANGVDLFTGELVAFSHLFVMAPMLSVM
jgi:hypothetical protein